MFYFSGNADNKFTISNSSGVISRSCEVKGQLDRETTDHYLLTVSVHDSLNHNVSGYLSLRIRLLNHRGRQIMRHVFLDLCPAHTGQFLPILFIGVS